MMNLPNELENDSGDLSSEDVRQAIPTASVDVMLDYLHKFRCHKCECAIEIIEHALRRRTPFFYARMTLRCKRDHKQVITFRADWLAST